MSSTRQLAAIMFMDIEGYTAVMQEDEGLALKLLDKFRRKVEKEVADHHGRILELRGDGALCSFPSTLECVRAALAIQVEMQAYPKVPLRIAIHTGDIITDGDAIYGDGVNIASRMETLAVPGSIFISGRVYDDIRNQKDITAVSMGRYLLKNVREELELYALSHPGIVLPDSSNPDGKGQKVGACCILVLPFANLSQDPKQEYFSEGLTEELIYNLSKLNDLRVISRTTSMKYKNTDKDAITIGKETGASYIMEGSVRTQGKQIRITAQFIDAARDVHLWADSFQGTLDDVFDIQEKVASNIADALKYTLSSDEKDKLQKRPTGNIEAYQLYLQGRFFWNKRNEESLLTASRFFERSIDKDPKFALAWAGLADTYNLLGEYTNYSRKELHPKGKAAVNKALELDKNLAEAHISYASLLMLNEWDWKRAENEFKIGIELNPNYATAHHWYSELLLFEGKAELAIDEIELAVTLDPVSMAIMKDYGMTLYYARHYDQAIEKALATLVLDPDFIAVHRLLSLCYQGKGLHDLALIENDKWGELTRNATKTKLAKAQILATAGRTDEARKHLHELITNHELGHNDYRSMGLIFAALSDLDAAFEWLNKSVDRHEEALCSLKVDPKLDNIREDPRFDELVKRIGLPV